MKFGVLLFILLSFQILVSGFASAGDVSCQVDLLKPKVNAVLIQDEADKPASLTVADTKLRLQQHQSKHSNTSETAAKENDKQLKDNSNQETAQSTPDKVNNKTAKKSSGMGGIFDILLPSKLRDSVN